MTLRPIEGGGEGSSLPPKPLIMAGHLTVLQSTLQVDAMEGTDDKMLTIGAPDGSYTISVPLPGNVAKDLAAQLSGVQGLLITNRMPEDGGPSVA